MNKAAENIWVQISVWTYVFSFGYIPRSLIPRSYGKSMFSFIRNCQTCLPQWLYHFALSPAMNESSCCSISSSAPGVVSALDFSHSDRCRMISYCFNLQFPNGIYSWVSFHMLICHLYIFFGEASLQIFCPFLNWIVCFLVIEF